MAALEATGLRLHHVLHEAPVGYKGKTLSGDGLTSRIDAGCRHGARFDGVGLSLLQADHAAVVKGEEVEEVDGGVRVYGRHLRGSLFDGDGVEGAVRNVDVGRLCGDPRTGINGRDVAAKAIEQHVVIDAYGRGVDDGDQALIIIELGLQSVEIFLASGAGIEAAYSGDLGKGVIACS